MQVKQLSRLLLWPLKTKLRELREQPENLFVYLIAVAGLVSEGIALYERFGWTSVLLGFAVIVILYVLLLRARPTPRIELPTHSIESPYRICIPPDHRDVRFIINRSQTMFRESALHEDSDFQAFLYDPYSVVILKDSDGKVCGFLDNYCFRTEDVQAYIMGDIGVDDFFAEKALKDPDARSAGAIYFPTIVNFSYLLDGGAFWRSRENACMVWAMAKLIRETHHFPEGGLELYASAWSKEGREILQHFRFKDTGRKSLDGASTFVRRKVMHSDLDAVIAHYEPLARGICVIEWRHNVSRGTPE